MAKLLISAERIEVGLGYTVVQPSARNCQLRLGDITIHNIKTYLFILKITLNRFIGVLS